MAKGDKQGAMKMIHCIFHTSKGKCVGNIASRANYKQVAEAVIEDSPAD
jgi:hypothetical protein